MPAESSQKREALWGTIWLVTLVLAFLLIFFVADVRRLFTRTDDLHVFMPSAAGLRPGSLVWIAGQTVGEVKEIEVRPPGSDSLQRVIVLIEVERRHREHIRQDSEARVTSFSVIGDPVLDITPGNPAAPGVDPGDTLAFRTAGTPAEAIVRARSLHAGLRELIAESRTLTAQSRDRAAQAARIRARLEVTARELRAFTSAVEQGPLKTLGDPEFKRLVASLGETAAELRNSFTRSAERARAARAQAAPALERLAARADTISRMIGQLQQAITAGGGGLLTRAATDTAIVKALHGAQAQLDSLVAETKRNPLRFWF